MQLIAVVGSLTAGEIALSAMSTIWMMPNSTSCCIVRVGPMSMAVSSRLAVGGHAAASTTRINGAPAGTN